MLIVHLDAAPNLNRWGGGGDFNWLPQLERKGNEVAAPVELRQEERKYQLEDVKRLSGTDGHSRVG